MAFEKIPLSAPCEKKAVFSADFLDTFPLDAHLYE
jgi:hypothetical protein